MGLLYARREAGGRTRVPRKWDLLPRLQLPAALSLWAALPELPVHVCELPRSSFNLKHRLTSLANDRIVHRFQQQGVLHCQLPIKGWSRATL